MYESLIIKSLNLNHSLNSDLENLLQDIKLINEFEDESDDDLEDKLKDEGIPEEEHGKSDQLICYWPKSRPFHRVILDEGHAIKNTCS